MHAQRIAVIGGSGFVGTSLVRRLLAAGHRVAILDKTKSRAYPELSRPCDVRDPGAIQDGCRDSDVIYNLAAEHRDDVTPRSLYDEVNVGGARNICTAADTLGIGRIVFTSSVAVYGFCKDEADEDTPPRPVSDYGRTKLEAEEVFRRWRAASSSRSLTIVRPTVVFGEGNRGNVYNLLRQIDAGRFVMIGDGRNRKSMAYVENVAAFLDFVLRFDRGQRVLNYVDKPDFDMRTLVRTVSSKLGRRRADRFRVPYGLGYGIGRACDAVAWISRRKLAVSAVRVEKFCADTRFSAAQMLATGFTPPVSLEDGLDRTIHAEFGAGGVAERAAA